MYSYVKTNYYTNKFRYLLIAKSELFIDVLCLFTLFQSDMLQRRKMVLETNSSYDQVIFVTAGYDHQIRFWQAHSGVCHRTLQHQDSVTTHI